MKTDGAGPEYPVTGVVVALTENRAMIGQRSGPQKPLSLADRTEHCRLTFPAG
jgi:hypothetical protein